MPGLNAGNGSPAAWFWAGEETGLRILLLGATGLIGSSVAARLHVSRLIYLEVQSLSTRSSWRDERTSA